MPGTSLEGRVAIVTGASRGIGFAISEHLAGLGSKVVLSSRKEDELKEAADRINSRFAGAAVAVPAHAGRPTDIDRLVKATLETFGAIHILIVNAGTNPYMGDLLDIDAPAWDKVFEVNVRGAFLLIQAAVRAWM